LHKARKVVPGADLHWLRRLLGREISSLNLVLVKLRAPSAETAFRTWLGDATSCNRWNKLLICMSVQRHHAVLSTKTNFTGNCKPASVARFQRKFERF
jgi:hypothetical protein